MNAYFIKTSFQMSLLANSMLGVGPFLRRPHVYASTVAAWKHWTVRRRRRRSPLPLQLLET
jgi:hypothetical protein